MKNIGIGLLTIAVIILLIGIVSPVNIIICTLIAITLFIIGVLAIRKQ